MLKEILLAALGATGFAIIFGIKRTKLWNIFLAGGLSWYGYIMLCQWVGDDIIAMFLITVFVVIMAKMNPSFSTPVLIPFIPGATLYYVMNDLVSKNKNFVADMWLLLCQVGAMALGILVAQMMVIVFGKMKVR